MPEGRKAKSHISLFKLGKKGRLVLSLSIKEALLNVEFQNFALF